MKRVIGSAKKMASSMKPVASASDSNNRATATSSTASTAPPRYPQCDGAVRTDKYGFLLEDGEEGEQSNEAANGSGGGGGALGRKQWEAILRKDGKSGRPSNKVKYCTRRGLPDSMRQRAWTVLTGVDALMAGNPTKYTKLVEEAEEAYQKMRALEDAGKAGEIDRAGTLLEAIERDICRTLPQHYMFRSGSDEDHDGCNDHNQTENGQSGWSSSELSDSGPQNITVSEEEQDNGASDNSSLDIEEIETKSSIEAKRQIYSRSIQKSLQQMSADLDDQPPRKRGSFIVSFPSFGSVRRLSSAGAERGLLENFRRRRRSTNGSVKDAAPNGDGNGSASRHPSESPAMGHGQAPLRNVLRAYCLHDPDVGYCQGMNFVAAMFLTFLSEEESFWLLVVIMRHEPYHCRNLFREDMAGTHEVLFVAEKLLNQFLPELSRHMEAENVHVTMFVTQWLVTLYVREFPFDLVARVWDSFLVEGWKVVYRVLLSLMESASGDILGMTFEQILHYLRDFPSSVNGPAIMAGSLEIPLKTKHIQKYADEWRRLNAS